MIKTTTAGSEVDSWCTKCKLDLNHRIIAMEGDRIKRVECLTCRGHHNYRRPKSADPLKKTTRKKTTRARKSPTRISEAEQRRREWEEAIMGKSPDDFVAYNIKITLAAGLLIRHKKFGDGWVREVVEGGKARVLFEDAEKLLVYGR